jgi:hypothetical protein
MAQRGLVVASQAAMERAEASVNKAQQREWEAIETQLFPCQAKRFETPEATHVALAALAKSRRYHQGNTALCDRTQTLRRHRAADPQQPNQGD